MWRTSMVAGSEALSSFKASFTMSPTCTGLHSCSVFLLKASICLTSSLALSADSSTCWRVSYVSESSGRSERASSVKPMIDAKMLLKSWAIPPARVPMASIFCACRSWLSSLLIGDRSRLMMMLLIILPRSSNTGEIVVSVSR